MDRRFSLPRIAAPVALLGLALDLGACAAVPHLGAAPEVRTPDSFAASRSLSADGDAPAAWPVADWWHSYGDPQLDGLIAEGLAGSPDLAAALARVRRADALAEQAGAARLPSLDVGATVGATKQSYNNGIPADFVPKGWNDTGRLEADLGFDLDLWGRNRAAFAAARSDAEAARLDREQAALTLTTGIAGAYADLAALYAVRAIQQNALEVRQGTQKLTADRVANGLDTQAEQKQADAAVPAGRAAIAATDEQIALTRNRLAALLGKGPDRGLDIAAPALPASVQGVPAGLTTDLIGRRPDIVAARARVEAAASRIKVARADFYPAINLSAIVGLQSLGLGNLLKGGSTFGTAGPALSLPIFRGGELQGRYRGARADYDEAVASYDRTVTDAYRAVADALASRRSLGVQLDESRRALADSEAAYRVARLRYEGGLSRFLDVLAAQDRVLEARRSVADLQARGFSLDIALVRALGGGFTAPQLATRTSRN
ncbi:multidrug RND transporter [Sphingomonas metalli]|uniref:Multidrug RND transporter n=1 Tax=Sphingomonas metalli TaxID=1779358 RepID=A0A916T369_9SPHN|nr:efflux transporter outer membrane subunit [Sphingomonas metalli]GGB29177.1 multidrug RND transporter [Sphingomonas metalli]